MQVQRDESRIAVGVNRALEAFRQGQNQRLELEQRLSMLEDQDVSFLVDSAISRYLLVVTQFHDQAPPELPAEGPAKLADHWTPRTLLAELDQINEVDDLLTWLLERCQEATADQAVNFLQAITEMRSERAKPATMHKDYTIKDICVDAHGWRWESCNGKS